MKKDQIIKETIGEVLEPAGFTFNNEIGNWCFVKEFKNSKGETARQAVIFWTSRFEKKLFIRIDCFSGGISTYDIKQFAPGYYGGLSYGTNQEFKKVVEIYANIIKQYGLDFLKKIEEPKRSDYFREEDYYRLFNEYESMAQKFIKEQKIDIECITIEDAVKLMKNIVLEKKEKPFEYCRELFLEMAAFYGCVLRKYYSCKWKLNDFKTHAVCTLEIESERKAFLIVTKEIHFAWKKSVDELDSLII